MTHLTRRSLILIAALAGIAESAYGQICVTSGTDGNTACGSSALENGYSDGGYSNSAFGIGALQSNTSGFENTASGAYALAYNHTGSGNTASGSGALVFNWAGSENTASGVSALEYNSSGSDNTASGAYALFNNTTGDDNTASGYYALYSNTTGTHNTASGYQALYSTTTGIEDTGVGYGALHANTTGKENTALGNEALYAVTTGTNNIAMGFHAGIDLTSGSNDIDIGNAGVAAESGVIRIGSAGTQTRTFVAGIENSKVTGAAVYVTSSGQLGVLASSERYKTGIAPMGSNTAKLKELRPVTFHLKTDPKGDLQYGLIAEEVVKVYPELVIRNEEGRIEGVRYDELAPMLLNEMQKQAAKIASLEQQLAGVQAALVKLQPKDQLVAQR